jgi:hypothetical protein
MHTLVITTAGVVGMVAVTLVAHAVNRQRHKGFVDGGRLFVWLWLLLTVSDFAMSIADDGIPPIVALGEFAVAFGLPAALALIVWGSLRRRRLAPETTET